MPRACHCILLLLYLLYFPHSLNVPSRSNTASWDGGQFSEVLFWLHSTLASYSSKIQQRNRQEKRIPSSLWLSYLHDPNNREETWICVAFTMCIYIHALWEAYLCVITSGQLHRTATQVASHSILGVIPSHFWFCLTSANRRDQLVLSFTLTFYKKEAYDPKIG